MQLVKLKSREQFKELKPGDLVIVKWRPGSQEGKRGNVIAHYPLVEVKEWADELILQIRNNVYFNIGQYLEGKSWAIEAYVLDKAEGHQSIESA